MTALLVGACGQHPPAPVASVQQSEAEQVARAWNDAINHDLHVEAAALFADGAVVRYGRDERRLRGERDRIAFNAGLPCQGRIVAFAVRGPEVTLTLLLDHRGTFACNGVGTVDTAVIEVRDGLIVRLEQLPD